LEAHGRDISIGAPMHRRSSRLRCTLDDLEARYSDPADWKDTMNLTFSLAPVVSLIAGILILVVPRLLNYIVAIYLIVIGLLGLFGTGSLHLK
jgi:hypothetical protein